MKRYRVTKRLTCALLFATALTAQPLCAIRGMVVDALTKQPLPGTRVFAETDSDAYEDSAPPVRQISGSNGAFCFETLTPSDYHIRASRAFYVDANYGEHWPGDPGQSLEVSAGKSPLLISIKMMPQAVISGVLVDADGDPLQGAWIELLQGRWKARRLTTASIQETTTDDQGRYRFAKLAAGTYFLSASPALARGRGIAMLRTFLDQSGQPSRQLEGRTYYKDSISFRDATPIRVGAGQEVSNLTLTLRTAEARHVSGQAAPEALNTSPRTLEFFEEDSGSPGVWFSVPIQNDGHFLADGLFPDRYVIRGPGVVRKEIDVTNGDIDGLSLEANQPIELRITAHFQELKYNPILSLTLVDKTPNSGEGIRSTNIQGVAEKFKLAVLAGQYEIAASGGGTPYFIESVTVDGERQPRSILNVKGGAPKSIELFLSSKLASVEGRVTADHPLEHEVTLLLEDESDPESPTKPSQPDGQFQWTLLRAGTYRVYAFEEFNPEWWGNPELAKLLAPKSVVLEVAEGQHLHVSVPLISAEDFQTAVRKAGF